MRAIDRKLLRDAWRLKSQLIAIALVMACGIGAFLMAVSASRSLEATQAAYYERAAFAHVFAQCKRAPLSLADRVREIPGVAAVEPRVVVSVNLDIPGMFEPAAGLIVSIPDRDDPILNRLHLRRGRLPEPGRPGEVVVSEAFAEAHAMQPGFTFGAVINGRLERLAAVGFALSPEFIYSLRPGSFVPDDKRYGVMWMRRDQLAPSFDLDGAFNNLAVAISPNSNEAAIIDAIDHLTGPYGGESAHGRDEQVSHRYVSDELSQLRNMVRVTPPMFLAVAAMLVSIVVSRLVRTQREQIAVLRAFGYTAGDVGRHFLALVAMVGVLGAVLGIVLGAAMGNLLTSLYVRFFRFPELQYHMEAWVGLVGIGATTGAATIGAAWSVLRAMRMSPADAMRPEAPAVYRVSIVERLGLDRALWPSAKMVLRHLQRHKTRTAISMLGVAATVAILTLGSFVGDAIDELIELEFHTAQRQDVLVTFNEPRATRALHALRAAPGVITAEPYRVVPARIWHGPRLRREPLQGLPSDGTLRRVVDDRFSHVHVPPDALVISAGLAELLDARRGDELVIETLEGQRPTLRLRVHRVVETYVGTGAYVDMATLNRAMGEGPTLSGAALTVDAAASARLYQELKQTPGVATVTIKRAALESFEETLAENLLTMRLFNLAFACVIAVGVVYNTARILYAERAHELATLRVLGFYRSEIAGIFLGELAVITLVALPVGVAAGYLLCGAATWAMQTETHRIPYVVAGRTLAFAGTVVLLAATTTALFVRQDLDRLNLVEVLKARI
ncbi:MAG: ABC transporter permease [Phycisphaeraceae bacterium]|nr:ABC transporter permease [Phycisphaeraceae bacterium]